MKLYYLAGSCALAPHIALEASGLPYQAVRIERGKQTDPEYLAVNLLGRVPALVTAGHGTITEVPAVLSFIADAAPNRCLTSCTATPAQGQQQKVLARDDVGASAMRSEVSPGIVTSFRPSSRVSWRSRYGAMSSTGSFRRAPFLCRRRRS